MNRRELTNEQAIEIGQDLFCLRQKYKEKCPNLTLAGWIEQLGSTGRKYLAAERGEINVPINCDDSDPRNDEDFRALFDGEGLKDASELSLKHRIIQCLFIGCCVSNFGTAKTAAETILRHIAECGRFVNRREFIGGVAAGVVASG